MKLIVEKFPNVYNGKWRNSQAYFNALTYMQSIICSPILTKTTFQMISRNILKIEVWTSKKYDYNWIKPKVAEFYCYVVVCRQQE